MKVLYTTSALLGALAVIAGAFGAHALKDVLTADQLHTFETGVRYQFYHVLAILVVFLTSERYPSANFKGVVRLFLLGILFFSGSLYLLACKDILHLGNMARIIGPITPIGGLFFIAGWLALAWQFKNIDHVLKHSK